jgi:hypothetical protein
VSRQDRRDGQRDGAEGKRIDGSRIHNEDYRRGLQGGRTAETHRQIAQGGKYAGQRNPNLKEGK